MELRDPQEIIITDGDGRERKFFLSKMSAWDGLEIMERLPPSLLTLAVPKISDWPVVKEMQLKIMQYVAVEVNGTLLPLSTQALIENHCGDWECLRNLLLAEVKYNNRFFRSGNLSDFFAEAFRLALAKISETLTNSSEQSSESD